MSVNTLKGFVIGMENMGAGFVKVDCSDIFFNVKKGSDIDDNSKLKRAKKAFSETSGLRLRVRRVD